MTSKRFVSKLDIRGQICKIYLYTGDDWDTFCKKEGAENSDAFFDADKMEIFFNRNKLDIFLIRHEIMHAYVKSCFVERANLTREQSEEIICETIAYFGPRLLEQAENLYKKLKEKK